MFTVFENILNDVFGKMFSLFFLNLINLLVLQIEKQIKTKSVCIKLINLEKNSLGNLCLLETIL